MAKAWEVYRKCGVVLVHRETVFYTENFDADDVWEAEKDNYTFPIVVKPKGWDKEPKDF